jgi:methionyl-tRNA formyltransferase
MSGARWTVFADGHVGAEVLRTLARYNADSVAAVVAISKPAPEQTAAFKNAQFFEWAEIFNEDGIERLAGISEIVLLAWWPHILTGKLLELGQKVMLNMHPSLLPHGRGKDPNFWCLVENRPLGVTIHHVHPRVDSGDIAFQKTFESSWVDTGETVYRRSQQSLIELFEECCPQIAELKIPRIKQNLEAGSFHKRDELDAASFIDLDKLYTGHQLLTLLRARTFVGRPSCWFREAGKTYEASINIRVKENGSI